MKISYFSHYLRQTRYISTNINQISRQKPKLKVFLLVGAPALAITGTAVSLHLYIRNLGLSYLPKRTLRARKASIKSRDVIPPVRSSRNFIFFGFRFWKRFFEIFIIFTPLILFSPFSLISDSLKVYWNKLLRKTLQAGGPMFTKLGQWASTRSDLFSPDLRSALSLLHSNVKVQSFKDTEKTILKALNIEKIEEYFLKFDQKPVGAGVMAQVYSATLLDGRQVAVKVRRKSVKNLIYSDLLLLNEVSDFFHKILPYSLRPFSIKNAITQFSTFMKTQLDLNQEFQNLKTLASNFVNVPKIKIPTPIYASNDGTILIETLEKGETLSFLIQQSVKDSVDFKENSILNDDKSRRELGKIGLHAFLKMALVDNFCHSDMHPGNLLVDYEPEAVGSSGSRLSFKINKLIILDAGLVTVLSSRDQKNFLDLFTAVATGNGQNAGRLMIERSDENLIEATESEQKEFISGISQIVSEVAAKTFQLKSVSFGDVLQRVLNLVYTYRIPIDPNFSTLVLSLGVAEGVLRQLDEDLDIFGQSMPYILLANPEYKKAAIEKITEVLHLDVENVETSIFYAS